MEIDKLDPAKSKMQSVKQRFFALRNGIVADFLRKAGSPYRIIFGLNLPQLQEVASVFGYDDELAEQLWRDTSARESRLLAPMLINPADFSIERAVQWIEQGIGTTEEIDLFCHNLLRKMPGRTELFDLFSSSENVYKRYAALRLGFTIASTDPEKVLSFVEKEIGAANALTQNVAHQLREHIMFLQGNY